MILEHLRREDLVRIAYHLSAEEGTALFWSGGDLDSAKESFLFLCPIERLEASEWEQLETMKPGLWAGYLGYEMGAVADRDCRRARRSAPTPDALFYRYAACIRVGVEAELVVDETASESARWLFEPNFWKDMPLPLPFCSLFRFMYPMETAEVFTQKVEAALDYIRAGDAYQLCLSHECWLEGQGDPFQLFWELSRRNPSPFSAYLNCGSFQVVSGSPERFLHREGERLETRPIKGTAPRGKTKREDLENLQRLLDSEKEQAELMMITDLLRHDLGKVSVPGSVRALEVGRIEAYANVFHRLSVVTGQLREGISSLEALRQAFPGGSISGCPKLRALEIIDAIEQRPRGIYTGAIGYFWGEKAFDFNLAIRTLVAFPDRLNIQLGAGIVADSDPMREYEETVHKGTTVFEVLGVA